MLINCRNVMAEYCSDISVETPEDTLLWIEETDTVKHMRHSSSC